MTKSEIYKVIVEKGEGGKWKDSVDEFLSGFNPDFSDWENFGRLLKVAEKHKIKNHVITILNMEYSIDSNTNIDQIPLLVATETAKVLNRRGDE